MSNELTSRIAMPIAPASVEQTGTTNVNVTNQVPLQTVRSR